MNTTHQHPDFRKRLSALALAPGVYLMKDAEGTIIYVGKAMALRNRVRSYFQATRHRDPKTRELVSHIADFDVIRTDTPTEALILENELIKKYLPKYNVMLKDSKTYPYLKITEEEWPRVISTRQILKDGGRYYGPYTSAGAAYQSLNLLNRLFPYRKCDKKITGDDEDCLYYHMHQCTAPCIRATDRATYMEAIEGASLFLSGRGEEVVGPLERDMQQAADAWNFERAGELRDRISAVRHVLERQKIVSPNGTNADVIAVSQGAGGDAGVQVGFLRNGKLLGSEFFPMRATVDDTTAGILAGFVTQFYDKAAMVPPQILVAEPLPGTEAEVILPWLRERRGGKVEVVVPRRGDKRGLVEMVAKSADQNLEQNRLKFLSDEMKMTAAMTELASALDLPRLPRRIECFDISNTQGTNPVASMVVFIDGRPAKKEYRRFGIKTVTGSNDFAMMHEVILRRFRRAAQLDAGTEHDDIAGDGDPVAAYFAGPATSARAASGLTGSDEGADATERPDEIETPATTARDGGKWAQLPDLVIVDGGKGQLNAALDALREAGVTGQPIAGLAKENEELFLPGRSVPVLLPRDSQALYMVQRVRDEAHRFAVTFHRTKRSKAAVHSKLDDVPGIGPKRRKALIAHFGSLRGVQAATIEELTAVEGISTAVAAAIKATI